MHVLNETFLHESTSHIHVKYELRLCQDGTFKKYLPDITPSKDTFSKALLIGVGRALITL